MTTETKVGIGIQIKDKKKKNYMGGRTILGSKKNFHYMRAARRALIRVKRRVELFTVAEGAAFPVKAVEEVFVAGLPPVGE
jgi:hypothetical protein